MTTPQIPTNVPKWIQEHVKLYLADPEKGHMWDSTPLGGPGVLPALLLTMTGAKTGEKRILPLIYQKVGDRFVIIGSKGGAPDHPLWYKNLVKTPACHIQVAADHYDCVARTAEGAEREELWAKMAEIYPPYNDYQESAGDRQIPVVVLDPV